MRLLLWSLLRMFDDTRRPLLLNVLCNILPHWLLRLLIELSMPCHGILLVYKGPR